MDATAPRIGMPAATKPPKTNTITSRLTGRAMPSPTRRSCSTWWLMSLTSRGTPLTRTLAPGTADSAVDASRSTRSMAASSVRVSRPGSRVDGDEEPAGVSARPGPDQRRGGR